MIQRRKNYLGALGFLLLLIASLATMALIANRKPEQSTETRSKATTNELKIIDLITIADPASNYATYQSHNQKVIANQHGIFISYQLSYADPATYHQITWRLARSTDGGNTFTTIFESVDPTNPPAIETDSNGVIYLVRNDHSAQGANAYLYRFYPDKNFQNPTITTIPSGGFAGKFAMIIDESRQQLYYAKYEPMIVFTIGLDGTIKNQVQINTSNVGFANYPHFTLDEHNNLYLAWLTNRGANANYRSIHVIKSLDGGQTWRKLDGTQLTIPVIADETGPTDRLIFHSEFDGVSWLGSYLAKNNKIHFMFHTWHIANGVWTSDTQYYARYDLTTGARDKFVEGPSWSGETLSISNFAGICATDRTDAQAPIYCTSGSKDNKLVTLVSYDDGDSWHDYAVSAPLAKRAGSTFTTENLYSIGGYRGITPDGYLIGSLTHQKGPVSQNPPDSAAIFFRVKTHQSPTVSTTPTETPTSSPTPTNTPTSTPLPSATILALLLRFQGITQDRGPRTLRVVIKHESYHQVFENAQAQWDEENKAYKVTLSVPEAFPTGDNYTVLIDGQSHLAKGFSQIAITKNQTTVINKTSSTNMLLAGDVNDDNKLTIQDFGFLMSAVTQLTTPITPANTHQLSRYDLNADSALNIQDAAILLSNYTQLEKLGDTD